jgi:hypothetical protein
MSEPSDADEVVDPSEVDAGASVLLLLLLKKLAVLTADASERLTNERSSSSSASELLLAPPALPTRIARNRTVSVMASGLPPISDSSK